MASSAQHHREDGPTSSLGHVSMGREHYAEVVLLRLHAGWLARHRTIEKMSAPHHLEILTHGHRAVCSGGLIGSFLNVLEVEVGFQVAQQSSVSAM